MDLYHRAEEFNNSSNAGTRKHTLTIVNRQPEDGYAKQHTLSDLPPEPESGQGRALVRIDHTMHKPVRLPPRDHRRVPSRHLQNELSPPRPPPTRLQSRDPEHSARNPLTEHAQCVPVCVLLAAPNEAHVRGRAERLERADAQERRREPRQDARRLDALAGHGKVGQRYEAQSTASGDPERIDRYGGRRISGVGVYGTGMSDTPSEARNSRMEERRTASPSAKREKGVRPAPLSCSSYVTSGLSGWGVETIDKRGVSTGNRGDCNDHSTD